MRKRDFNIFNYSSTSIFCEIGRVDPHFEAKSIIYAYSSWLHVVKLCHSLDFPERHKRFIRIRVSLVFVNKYNEMTLGRILSIYDFLNLRNNKVMSSFSIWINYFMVVPKVAKQIAIKAHCLCQNCRNVACS